MSEDSGVRSSSAGLEDEERRFSPPSSFSWRSSLTVSLLIAIVWVIIRLAWLSVLGFPDPHVHDEFNYLLGADTFAHGRLTNPPHALPAFFASPHTLMTPTYSSKYPPGQSVFLAAGQVFFGHPFYGVVLEGALMMFLLCLMLALWTSPWPAGLVSLALAIFFQPPMYWVDSYWGGCAAVCGAAMLLIAVGWLRISPHPFAGCIFAAGGMLLFVTRPYEGAFTTAAVLALSMFEVVLPRAVRRGKTLMKAAAYGGVVVVLGLGATAAHDFAVTGHPLLLPRQLYDGRFMVAPLFVFQSVRRSEPVYPNERLAAEHSLNGWEVSGYRDSMATQHGYPGHLVSAIRFVFDFLPQMPLLLFGLALLDRRLWFCLAVLAAGVFGNSLVPWQQQHYIAPSVPALALIWGILAQRALPIRAGKIPVGALAVAVLLLGAVTPSIGATLRARANLSATHAGWPHERTELIERLTATGKQNLIIVRYPTPYWRVVQEEWVWNSADIDRQPVIFAHDLGDARNSELLNYYRNRTAWLLTFDPDHPDKYFLNPYPR